MLEQGRGREGEDSATSRPPHAGAGSAPTAEEIEQLDDAQLEVERLLLERSLRRIAALVLRCEPTAKVLFIEVDSVWDYEPVGWSANAQLQEPREADSLEGLEEAEVAAGRERELANLVENLGGWEHAWEPYTRFRDPDGGRYSLDLEALRTARIARSDEYPRWWTVIGDWSYCPGAALPPWTELVRAKDPDSAARIAVRRRQADGQHPFPTVPGKVAILACAYAVYAGALPPAAQYA